MGDTKLRRRRSLSPREIPSYRIPEVAHYLRIPNATVRAWALGQGAFKPVLAVERPEGVPLLSFINLVEIHVLDALRRQHNISLQKVRTVIRYLNQLFPGTSHPLADHDLLTDGLEVFVDRLGSLISASGRGQLGIRECLEAHLRRVERKPGGAAARLYPFTRKREGLAEEPRLIVIDPEVQFGRPILAGSGVPTAVIADRYKAGDSIRDLARDYDRPEEQIEEAIRCELQIPNAA